MTVILLGIDIASVAGLAVYGLLGFLTLWQFLRHRHTEFTLPSVAWDNLPRVTVQLPIYNEREVVQRLITASANLEYPRDRLDIQILDDSTDDTTALGSECVSTYVREGINMTLIHRDYRRGFKAGALQEALESARGEYIAIFDADFVPPPDFLLRTIPHLVADNRMGVVQARWGHLNDTFSSLTGAQAIALDKHFGIEQLVRHRAAYFPKFNGSAGVWRRTCIVGSGGWQIDTVCEDLCLSIRAVLAGWRFHFANDIIAPAELPSTILAYKAQQARWAMGATQCLVKYAGSIWRAGEQSPLGRLYALLSMSAYLTQAFLLLLFLVQLPLLLAGINPPSWLLLFSILGLGQPVLFVLAQQTFYSDWLVRLYDFPALLLIAIGSVPNNTWAVLRALSKNDFTFARTPKGSPGSYPLSPGLMLIIELGLMVYSAITLIYAIAIQNTGPILLMSSALLGFGYVAYLGLVEYHNTP